MGEIFKRLSSAVRRTPLVLRPEPRTEETDETDGRAAIPNWFVTWAFVAVLLWPLLLAPLVKSNTPFIIPAMMMLFSVAMLSFLVASLVRHHRSGVVIIGKRESSILMVSGVLAAFLVGLGGFGYYSIQLIREFLHPGQTEQRLIDEGAAGLDLRTDEVVRRFYLEAFAREFRRQPNDKVSRSHSLAAFRREAAQNKQEAKRLVERLARLRADDSVRQSTERTMLKLKRILAANSFLSGNFDETLELLTDLPEDDVVLWARCGQLRAAVFLERKEFDKAAAELRHLISRIGEDRSLLCMLGSSYVRDAMQKGARILPGGDPKLLGEGDRADLDSAINAFERAVHAPEIVGRFVAPLSEFGPSISLAMAKGLRRSPVQEIREFTPDFQHALRMLKISIDRTGPGALRDLYLESYLAILDAKLDLFKESLPGGDPEALARLVAESASTDEARATCCTLLIDILAISGGNHVDSDNPQEVRGTVVAMESVLEQFGKALGRLDAIECKTQLCRMTEYECNMVFQAGARRTRPGLLLSREETDQILQCESRLDDALKDLETAAGRTDDYLVFLGSQGLRSILFSGIVPSPKKEALFIAGKVKMNSAIREISGMVDAKKASPPAAHMRQVFIGFLGRIESN